MRMIQVRQPSLADGDQIPVRAHRLYVPRARAHLERRNSKIAAVANLSRCKGVHHFRGDFGQKLGGGDYGLFKTAGFGQSGELFQSPRGLDLEIAGCRAAQ